MKKYIIEISLVIMILFGVTLVYGASTSTTFPGQSIPEVGDTGTGWATNIRGFLLSVDAEFRLLEGTVIKATGVTTDWVLASDGSGGTAWKEDAGAGGGAPDQNLFETVAGDAGTNPVADATTDTLNITGGAGVTTTGDSSTDTIDITVDHDAIANFVAAEHIDWTADQGATNIHSGNYTDTDTTYSAGNGITLSTTTFSADASTNITVNSAGISVANADSVTVGVVEIATISETNTDTSQTLCVSPDGLTDWTGSTNVTTLGTIATGTWNGTDIAVPDGGTGAGTLTDGGVLLGSGTGAITPMAVLSDSAMIVGDGTTDPVAESGATLRTSIGVGTGDTPQFTGIEVGAATDTSLTRKSAGVLQVEANELYVQGGTDVADADIVAAIMRDDEWTAATLTAPGKVELATTTESITGTDATRAVTPDGLTAGLEASTKNWATTGTINGLVNVTSTSAATLVLTAAQCASDLHVNGDNDVIDYTLPTAVAGQNCGFYTPFDAIMTVDTANTGDSIILGGTTLTAGNAVDSAASAGSYAYFMAISASQWSIIGEIKTWVDGGAD